MAASDYVERGEGILCPVGMLGSAIGRNPVSDIELSITNFEAVVPGEDVAVGMAVMVNDEIMRVDDIDGWPVIEVSRGCADTVPQEHDADSLVWFFSNSGGTDGREYVATDTVAVKMSNFTFSGGSVPVEHTPAHDLTFNWRFSRPYAPANVMVAGERWFVRTFRMGPYDTGLEVEWAHRDRVGQADQLLGHTEGSVGPEVGQTYTVRIYDDTDTLIHTYTGLTGTVWEYERAEALTHFPTGGLGYMTLCSTRLSLDSWQSYRIDFRISLGGLGEVLGENLGGS